jgi:NTP pyrophosphatase (non-canonical NTP hydrolase)
VELNEYQRKAGFSATYPNQKTGKIEAIGYCALGLAGEAGEVANKVKKLTRDGDTLGMREAIVKELGDCLWYVSQLAAEMCCSLNDVATINLEKLADRKERGTLHGSGDNR